MKERFSGLSVFLQVVPDLEAEKLASEIAGFVELLGWKPKFVNQSDTGVAPLDISEGVVVTSWRGENMLPRDFPGPLPEPEDRSFIAAEKLSTYFDSTSFRCEHVFHKRNGDALRIFPYMKVVPADGMFVSIGMKPVELELAIRREQRRFQNEIEQSRKLETGQKP